MRERARSQVTGPIKEGVSEPRCGPGNFFWNTYAPRLPLAEHPAPRPAPHPPSPPAAPQQALAATRGLRSQAGPPTDTTTGSQES